MTLLLTTTLASANEFIELIIHQPILNSIP